MQLINTTQAVALLQQGEVIAYPTEAVWGLGCDPHNLQALSKLFYLKQRSADKGLVLVASQLAQVAALLGNLPADLQHTITQSWAVGTRPTTWLLPHEGCFNGMLTGGKPTVAVRLCHHPVVQQLCNLYAGLIVSTSANVAGQPPALSLGAAQAVFGAQVHYLQGALGAASAPSRIIDASSGQIIRA
jgi:L-threonylcarbamoyladenylate synthase